MRQAVLKGKLPKLDGKIACVDCGKPARLYDHRDYLKPLVVFPVCHKCNGKRGLALNFDGHDAESFRIYPRTAKLLKRLAWEEGRRIVGQIKIIVETYEQIVNGRRPR